MKKFYVYSYKLQFVILAESPFDAIRRVLIKFNPNPKDFGKAIIVSEKGFAVENHYYANDKDTTYATLKTLKDLGYYNESET